MLTEHVELFGAVRLDGLGPSSFVDRLMEHREMLTGLAGSNSGIPHVLISTRPAQDTMLRSY